MIKLPAAWMCGVRVKELTPEYAEVQVRHRWINQNPFRSMYWAVQGMAAEMAAGILVMAAIRKSGKPVSMLVLGMKAGFTKKARGKVRFRCSDGVAVSEVLQQALATGEGQTCNMRVIGTDEQGDRVSEFEFEWTLKLRK